MSTTMRIEFIGLWAQQWEYNSLAYEHNNENIIHWRMAWHKYIMLVCCVLGWSQTFQLANYTVQLSFDTKNAVTTEIAQFTTTYYLNWLLLNCAFIIWGQRAWSYVYVCITRINSCTGARLYLHTKTVIRLNVIPVHVKVSVLISVLKNHVSCMSFCHF
jgi:hypothetical protein